MTRIAICRGVVVAVHLMSRGSEVQRTPGLVETEVADDVRNVIASQPALPGAFLLPPPPGMKIEEVQ